MRYLKMWSPDLNRFFLLNEHPAMLPERKTIVFVSLSPSYAPWLATIPYQKCTSELNFSPSIPPPHWKRFARQDQRTTPRFYQRPNKLSSTACKPQSITINKIWNPWRLEQMNSDTIVLTC